MSVQWKQSVISIKDKQTIISHLEKSENGTNLAPKFKISKQQISDIRKNKEILKFSDSVDRDKRRIEIWVLKASKAHLYTIVRKSAYPKGKILFFSEIQLVVYYQCCILIGWATTSLYVIAH